MIRLGWGWVIDAAASDVWDCADVAAAMLLPAAGIVGTPEPCGTTPGLAVVGADRELAVVGGLASAMPEGDAILREDPFRGLAGGEVSVRLAESRPLLAGDKPAALELAESFVGALRKPDGDVAGGAAALPAIPVVD